MERNTKGTLQNISTDDLRTRVFEQLLEQIRNGVWKPGEKIPSENELTVIMGVSRISIREAIQKLIALDLVETYRGKGTFVKEFTTNSYLNSLAPMLNLSKKDILHVLEYRRIFEVSIVDLYIEKVTEKDIVFLENLWKKMVYYKTNKKMFVRYDLESHLKLYEMTKNPLIIKISNMIRDILDSSMRSVLTHHGAEEGIVFHKQLIDTLKVGDAEELKKITNDLLLAVENEVKALDDF